MDNVTTPTSEDWAALDEHCGGGIHVDCAAFPLSRVAVPGLVRFRLETFRDEDGGRDYVSAVYCNPTYAQCIELAQEARAVTRDFSHGFFEDVCWDDDDTENGVQIAHFCLGS